MSEQQELQPIKTPVMALRREQLLDALVAALRAADQSQEAPSE